MRVHTKTTRVTGTKFSEHIGKNGYKLPMDLEDLLEYEINQFYNNSDICVLNISVQSIFDTFELGTSMKRVKMELPVIHWVTIIYK